MWLRFYFIISNQISSKLHYNPHYFPLDLYTNIIIEGNLSGNINKKTKAKGFVENVANHVNIVS